MCEYTGHEFGAPYPDSVCIDGFLWDADSGDGDGLTNGGDLPCPRCNTRAFLEDIIEDAQSCGMSMFRPWCGAVQFERACSVARKENPDDAEAIIASLPPFVAADWPDREAVYRSPSLWSHTVDVTIDPAAVVRAHKPPIG